MNTTIDLFSVIVSRTLRVPTPDMGDVPINDANTIKAVVYLDSMLVGIGFKMSTNLLRKLTTLGTKDVGSIGQKVYKVAQTLVGDHVRHNPLFKDFPDVVPEDLSTWWGKISSVPSVGHSFEDMLACHDDLVQESPNKWKVLDVGDVLAVECGRLFAQMASSPLPMAEDDKALFDYLCTAFGNYVLPETIPVAETRAIVNGHRIRQGLPLAVQSSTDILRAIAHRCGAPVDLIVPFKVMSLPRRERSVIAKAFETRDVSFFDGVQVNAEKWKRVFERLHPYEFKLAGVRYAADVALGKVVHTTPMGCLESYFKSKDLVSILDLGRKNPGIFVRSLDRILRTFPNDYGFIVDALPAIFSKVSTRVLVGLYNSLDGRDVPSPRRAFTNVKGKTHVQKGDDRATIPAAVITSTRDTLKLLIADRVFGGKNVVVGDDTILHMAVPVSEKNTTRGVGSWSVGTKLPIVPVKSSKTLRFFMYWHQQTEGTDLDLSVMLLDKDFNLVDVCSFYSLQAMGLTHSGDIRSAPDGASEFVDAELAKVPSKVVHIVPCVNVFRGEGFDKVKESFFGYMLRDKVSGGAPFEPLTVETKTPLRGHGSASIPMMFSRVGDRWESTTLNLFSEGRIAANPSTLDRIRGVFTRSYLTFYDLYRVTKQDPSLPSVYLGVNAPVDRRYESVITSSNITDIL